MHHRPRLSSYTREAIVEEVEEGTPVSQIARNFHVSRTTVYRWRHRYRQEGVQGLRDRSCRPHSVMYRLGPEEVDRPQGVASYQEAGAGPSGSNDGSAHGDGLPLPGPLWHWTYSQAAKGACGPL